MGRSEQASTKEPNAKSAVFCICPINQIKNIIEIYSFIKKHIEFPFWEIIACKRDKVISVRI